MGGLLLESWQFANLTSSGRCFRC